jgi:hypothetical protein
MNPPKETSMNHRFQLPFLIALFGFAGCASTTVKSVWKDPAWTAPPMGSILILAATDKIAIRRTAEDDVAKQLQARGVMASPSYPYGNPANPQVLQDKVRQANFEGVLVIQMVDQKTVVTQTPETTTINSSNGDPYGNNRPGYAGGGYHGGYNNGWGGYYDQSMTISRTASQTLETKVISLESKLFSAKENGQVVWSALTETIIPDGTSGHAGPLAKALVDSMAQSKIIPTGKR